MEAINASFNEVINAIKSNINSNINCNNIGRIINFDPTTNTVQVELMQLKQWNNTTVIPVILSDVPLVNFGSKNARITVNPVGSYCVLLTIDRNFDNFMATGEQYVPDSDRMHNISDCVALLTINSNVDEPLKYDEDAFTIYNKNTVVRLFDDNIKVNNAQYQLGNLISQLISTIKTATITQNQFSPAVQQNLQTIADQFSNLFPVESEDQ